MTTQTHQTSYADALSKALVNLTSHLAEHWSIYILLLLYAITRLLFIDMDLPPWERMTYQTVDELYYAQPAYEWLLVDRADFEHRPFNLIQNTIVALSALTFGWSYASIRMGSFVLGGFGLALIYMACMTVANRSKLKGKLTRNIIFIIPGLIFVFNIGFYYSTIVLEPSIAVATYTAAIIFALSRYQHNPIIIGGLVAFGPLFIYPYAAIYSTSLIIAIFWISWKTGPTYLLKAILGGGIVLLLFLLASAISNPNSISEFFTTTAAQGTSRLIDVTKYPISYLIEQYFLNDIPNINTFRHSTLALPIFIASLLIAISQIALTRRNVELTLAITLLMIGARFSFLFIEKTHFERKMSDITLALLFLTFFSSANIYSKFLGLMEKWQGAMKKTLPPAMFLATSLLIVPEAYSLHKEMTSEKKYNNREQLIWLGRYLGDCTVVGEWGLGLNIYGKYKTKLNPYRYSTPESYKEYSELLTQLAQSPDSVVVSSMPLSPKVSEDLRNTLVPIHLFQFNDGGKALSNYAVYVPRVRLAVAAPPIMCLNGLR